jgi:hypothetical protein
MPLNLFVIAEGLREFRSFFAFPPGIPGGVWLNSWRWKSTKFDTMKRKFEHFTDKNYNYRYFGLAICRIRWRRSISELDDTATAEIDVDSTAKSSAVPSAIGRVSTRETSRESFWQKTEIRRASQPSQGTFFLFFLSYLSIYMVYKGIS